MESGTVNLFETLDIVMRVSLFRIPDARCAVRMNLPESMRMKEADNDHP